MWCWIPLHLFDCRVLSENQTQNSQTYWIVVMYFIPGRVLLWTACLHCMPTQTVVRTSDKRKKPKSLKSSYAWWWLMQPNISMIRVLSRNVLFLPCGRLCWVSWAGETDQRSCGSSRCWLETVSFQLSTNSNQSSPSPKRMVLQNKRDTRTLESLAVIK